MMVFSEWLDEQCRDAHSSAGEILGTDQGRQKSYYWRKTHGQPFASGDKVWEWSQETIKSKKSFDLWERPYVVMARSSEVRYKLSKVYEPSRMKFLLFDIMKLYVEETVQPEGTFARKRPTPYRSANCFDDPKMHVEDEASWTNNREGFNQDPDPRPHISRRVPLRNQRTAETRVTTRGRNWVSLEPLVNPPVRRWWSKLRSKVKLQMYVDQFEQESHQFGLVSTS